MALLRTIAIHCAALLLAAGTVHAEMPATGERPPACVLTLEVCQLHWTSNPTEHAKDPLNALQFDVPADRGLCDEVMTGMVLSDRFRWGRWLFRQNDGQWSVKVVGKMNDGGFQDEPLPLLPSTAPMGC